jgi:flagellin
MLVLNTNMGSLNAQRALTTVQESQQTAMERLSSGSRINRAKDDAAGLSISDVMTTQITGINQAIRNSNDGISYVQTADGALEEVSEMLNRIRELVIQAGNGVNNSAQQDYIDMEVKVLGQEIGNVLDNTKFNGMHILTSGTIDIQAGWESGDTITVGASDISASLTNYTTFSNATGVANAKALGLTDLDTALDAVNNRRSELGAQQNRLEHNASNLRNVSENISASRSRILDTDFAAESAELARTNVLQQAGMAMLSQANQSGQQILSLLK